MKKITTLSASVTVGLIVFTGLTGCGNNGADDAPKSTAAKIEAIENNPDYKPEQKEKFKQQLAENERLKAMVEKRGKELDTGKPAPMQPR